jgi:hypothetical protein
MDTAVPSHVSAERDSQERAASIPSLWQVLGERRAARERSRRAWWLWLVFHGLMLAALLQLSLPRLVAGAGR